MRAATKARSLLGAILTLTACGPDDIADAPERYAEATCNAVETCGCLQFYDTPSACEDDLASRFSMLLEGDMKFNVDCFRQVVEEEALDDCAPVEAWPVDRWACVVFQGDKQVGDPCEDITLTLAPFRVNECAEGLYCFDGACEQAGVPQPHVSAGDTCVPEPVASCPSKLGADPTLYCSDEGICEYSPALGEPCDSPFACDFFDPAGPLYCQSNDAGGGICAVKASDGEPCRPEDWSSCEGWCDPADSLCKSAGPAICLVTHFPGARPDL